MILEETVRIESSADLKGYSNTGKKPFQEVFSGSSWSINLKKFVDKIRIIDRRSNRYYESIKNRDTGEVIHRCEEPLTQHRNHGSAKRK